MTERGIEANPEKCTTLINMKSPTSIKEVQRLTGRMTVLSRFLSVSGEKSYPYFACLKKSERFQWTIECEKEFQELKEYPYHPHFSKRSTTS